jgi:unsaturated rhamnogalacturonyl hydrolase
MKFGAQIEPFIASYLASWQPYRPYWNYEDGCIYKGCLDVARAFSDPSPAEFVYREVAARVAPDGAIRGYDPEEFNLDNVSAGRSLFQLFSRTGEERFRLAIERQASQLERHPRTRSGNYWHKKIYPNQVWLDGLYMAQPFRCAYAQLTQNRTILPDVLRQFGHVREVMRDATTGLYYHGWDESRQERWSNPATGCSPCFWGRAMGWFVMALADCIAFEECDLLRNMLRGTTDALMRVRSPNGLWYQVLDQGGRAGNYEEASASLMIAYAMMRGARLGVLDIAIGTEGLRSFQACVDAFLTDRELTGICGVAGLGNVPYRDGSYEYYISEPVIANDPKGVGAFLMALSEAQLAASWAGSRSPT